MPELPEVETVRRMLEATVRGRTIRSVERSKLALRDPADRRVPALLRGRTIDALRRHGKFLLIDLSGSFTIVSHLGMSGRWLFLDGSRVPALDHVHVRLACEGGTRPWVQDPRRFGM